MEKTALIQQLINAYSEAYVKLGHSSLMGKIVALLITSPEPLSLDDISEQLQMSKGPVSQISRKLKEHNLIEKVWIPGERKDFYRASPDIFGQAFANYASSMRRNMELGERFSALAEELDVQDEQAIHLKNRMDEMKMFYEMMDEYNRSFLKAWKKDVKPELKETPQK
jgi:DNA-binding transcriptional regulator GbsR (MarR family)